MIFYLLGVCERLNPGMRALGVGAEEEATLPNRVAIFDNAIACPNTPEDGKEAVEWEKREGSMDSLLGI